MKHKLIGNQIIENRMNEVFLEKHYNNLWKINWKSVLLNSVQNKSLQDQIH